MNSDAWLEKLLLAQRAVLRGHGLQAGGQAVVQHVLRFAKQRFESCAGPQRQFCCMYVAIAMVLAYVASDLRIEAPIRNRAAARLEQMPGYMLPQGIAASFSAESLEFVRLFDVADHDPALTWTQCQDGSGGLRATQSTDSGPQDVTIASRSGPYALVLKGLSQSEEPDTFFHSEPPSCPGFREDGRQRFLHGATQGDERSHNGEGA